MEAALNQRCPFPAPRPKPANWDRFRGVGYVYDAPPVPTLPGAWVVQALKGKATK